MDWVFNSVRLPQSGRRDAERIAQMQNKATGKFYDGGDALTRSTANEAISVAVKMAWLAAYNATAFQPCNLGPS